MPNHRRHSDGFSIAASPPLHSKAAHAAGVEAVENVPRYSGVALIREI